MTVIRYKVTLRTLHCGVIKITYQPNRLHAERFQDSQGYKKFCKFPVNLLCFTLLRVQRRVNRHCPPMGDFP